MGMLFLEVNQI